MRDKGFTSHLIFFVILTVATGCDNVEWAGTSVEIEPPPPPPRALEAEIEPEEEAERLEPIPLGTLLYLVERGQGGNATLLPVAEFTPGGFEPLPEPAETPDLVPRFPVDRWEEGTEFILFSQGARVGSLLSDGSSELDERFCLARARGEGVLHLRPDAVEGERFLALRRDDLAQLPSPLTFYPAVVLDDEIRNASLDAARTLIPELNVPWPPTVLGIRRRVDAFADGEGRPALAASFVFGDDLEVGAPQPTGYSLFLVSVEDEDGFAPVTSWYRRADQGPKAVPGFLAAHDLEDTGHPDLLLEFFGEEARWLGLLGRRGGSSTLLYQDPCGIDPGGAGLQDHD